jgi:hypothetical protein
MRNRIINGAMTIDQRNAGASVTPTNLQYGVDRWQAYITQASKFSMQQSSDAPVGFKNSLLITSLSSYSVASSDIFNVLQFIEGFNVADFNWGTANAQPVTLSFWVRSSLTGTFGGVLRNTGGGTRSYPFSYTISAANTWEYKTITVPGDTTGAWNTTNGQGIGVVFDLGDGSTYSGAAGAWANSNLYGTTGATKLVATNGATLYITGVQLEEGTAASPFENRLYGTELALCQRYYFLIARGNYKSIGLASYANSNYIESYCFLPVSMRTTPTLSIVTGTDYYQVYRNGAGDNLNSLSLDSSSTESRVVLYNTSEASGTGGFAGNLFSNNASSFLAVQAEL